MDENKRYEEIEGLEEVMRSTGIGSLGELIEGLGPMGEFKPHSYYNEYGNFIEFYGANEATYVRSIDAHLEYVIRQDTEEVIGFKIWGVTSLLEEICETQSLTLPEIKVIDVFDSSKRDIPNCKSFVEDAPGMYENIREFVLTAPEIVFGRESDVAEGEPKVLEHLVNAWNAFVKLPKQHPDDIDEFRHSLHRLQHLIGIRRIRRIDESWHNEAE